MELKKYNQLREEIARLEREAEKVRKEALKSAIQQIRDLMEEFGLGVEDIAAPKKRGRKAGNNGGKSAEAKSGKTPRAKVKPKYRSPDDKKLTWTGRGRTPKWVSAWVESGHSLEELLIS